MLLIGVSDIAIAVLRVGNASMAYGEKSIQGVAARLMSPISVAHRGSAGGNAG